MQIVRKSAFRHVFGNQEKEEQWHRDLKTNPQTTAFAASAEYFALPWAGGGGSVAVLRNDKPGKVSADTPLLTGHSGLVVDLDFSPFNSSILASASADATVKVWNIPQGGLTANINEPLVTLEGHTKKLALIKFHPTSANVIASAANDYNLKIWDVTKGKEMITIEGKHSNYILSLAWNWMGNQLVTTAKDRKVRIFDPRANAMVSEVEADKGAKGSLATWMGKRDQIFTVGFSQTSERVFKVFDPKNMSAPVLENVIDIASSVLVPHYDEDTSIMYLAGRGDSTIRYYEVNDEAPNVHYINTFSSAVQRSTCMLPKIACNSSVCEIARIFKLTNDAVVPVQFIVPRKSELFQADIFPETRGLQAGQSADDWFAGKDADVPVVSMKPGEDRMVGQEKAPEAVVSEPKPHPVAEAPKVEAPKPAPISKPAVSPKPAASPVSPVGKEKELAEAVEKQKEEIAALNEKIHQLEEEKQTLSNQLQEAHSEIEQLKAALAPKEEPQQ